MIQLPDVLACISYDQLTGEFRRVHKATHNSADRADRAGHLGYRVVNVKGKRYYAHRLAWMLTFGEWPRGEIDHKNGDPGDNRLENLREASREQNCGNVVKQVGKTGLFGVTKQPHTKRFRSGISVNGKRRHLGYFDTPQEAHHAAMCELDRIRGEFSPAKRISGATDK